MNFDGVELLFFGSSLARQVFSFQKMTTVGNGTSSQRYCIYYIILCCSEEYIFNDFILEDLYQSILVIDNRQHEAQPLPIW